MSANAAITTAKPDSSPRIRTRVLVLFGLALVILLVIMSITIFTLVTSTDARDWQDRQLETAGSAIYRVQDFIQDARRDLYLLANLDEDIQNHENLFPEVLRDAPQILEIVYVDAEGRILESVFQDAPLLANQVTLLQTNWFVESIGDISYSVYVSPIQVSVDEQPYIITSMSTKNRTAVIAARISLTVFSEIISQLSLGETGSAYVVSDDGFILAHTNTDVVTQNINILGRPEFDRALFQPLNPFELDTDQPLTEVYENFRGEVVVGLSQRIPGLGWMIFTEITEAEVLANTQTAITVLVIVSVGVFVLTLVVISEVQRRLIFKPLTELRANVDRVSQGSFDVPYQATSRDEIGEVIQSFNDMVRIVSERAIERDRLIRELQGAKRLAEENSRLKSEFLSTMSHELRTPMNAIEGFVGIILSRMGGTEYNDKTATYLQRVRANSQRLLALINDFLDLSRVESGRLDLASQPFEPAKLAQRWRSELGVLAENKQIDFDVVIDPELPKTLIGDEEAISKVAINLIGNAIKFTEKGKVTVALESADKEWNIVVRDTGIGIPPHAREFVFEEFRQVDQSSRRKHGGTGLGLAIVQKYTRSMGGQVTLKSEVGQGSEFTVTLPVVTVQQLKKAKEA